MKPESKPETPGDAPTNPDRPISANGRAAGLRGGRKTHLTDHPPKPPYVVTMEGAYLPLQEYDPRRRDILVHAEASL